MQHLQFSALTFLLALPYNVYGMLPESEMFHEEFVNSLSDPFSAAPVEILADGIPCTSEEYFYFAGANNAKCGLGRKYLLELQTCKRDLERIFRAHYVIIQNRLFLIENVKIDRNSLGELLDNSEKFICLFPYDNTLKYLLGTSNLIFGSKDSIKDARNLLAHSIFSSFYDRGTAEAGVIEMYLNSWQHLMDKTCGNKIECLKLALQPTNKYSEKYHQKGNNLQQSKAREKAISENCEFVFSAIHKYSHEDRLRDGARWLYSEAAYISIKEIAIQNGWGSSIIENASEKILEDYLKNAPKYKQDSLSKMSTISPYIILDYAQVLVEKNDLSNAVPFFAHVLELEDPENCFRIPYHYVRYANCLYQLKEYSRLLPICEKIVDLENTLAAQWDLAIVKILLGKYDDNILEIMKEQLLQDDKNDEKISFIIYSSYHCALQIMGKTEELNQLLFQKQQEALERVLEKNRKEAEKSRKTAAAIKEEYNERNRQEQERQRMYPSAFGKTKESNTTLTISTTSTTSTCTSDFPSFYVKKNREDSLSPQKREKKKTKGVADPQRPPSQPREEEPKETSKRLIFIKNIINSSKALKIFDKFFSFYQGGTCFNNHINISLHEVNTLFKAIKDNEQVKEVKKAYDTSKGKGSHKKLTLNFQKFGSAMEDQMVTLTKDTVLTEYQIAQIREAFIKAGVVPDDTDIIKVLKKDFPDMID